MYGRPSAEDVGGFRYAIRMVDVGGELEAETRGIDVTRRAESIGEGIEF